MRPHFWKKSKKPVMALAPMANVTDAAFRRIIAKYSRYGGRDIGDGSKASLPAEAFRVGGPDVMWTEFVSADGLMSRGRDKLMIDLKYSEAERPIVAQFFSSSPDVMERTAAFAAELGFDGIDINMGCPDRSIEKSGAGAALMKDPELAQEIIQAAKHGSDGLPVSVKTRLGYDKMEYETWLPALLETEPAAITMHLRTRKEMSEVPAHWELAERIVNIRNAHTPGTILLGNGDVASLADAARKVSESGMDGVMIGRGIFGNPWFFSGHEPSVSEKLDVALEHARLYEELYGPEESGRWKKSFDVMKKHFKAYVNGFDGAKELRLKLMEAGNSTQVAEVLAKNPLDVYNSTL